DDLGVPRALSVVFASVTEGAKLLDSGTDSQQLARIVAEVELMLDILGVNPSAEAWAVTASDAKAQSPLEALIATMAERRAEAKAVKDFATADSIRDELAAAGVVIEDTADGYRYHLGERSEEHTSELQSRFDLVCRLLLEKKKHKDIKEIT